MKSTPCKCYFLDTSTQIQRVWGHPRMIQIIEEQLQGSNLYSSKYVLNQYKGASLNPVIVTHTMIQKHEKLDFDGLVNLIIETVYIPALKNAHGKGTPREMHHVILALAKILKSYSRRFLSVEGLDEEEKLTEQKKIREDILEELEELIEDGWEECFFRGAFFSLIDRTKCTRAAGKPRRHRKFFFRFDDGCSIEHPKDCGICEFWKENVPRLNSLSMLYHENGEKEKKLTFSEALGKVAQDITKKIQPKVAQGRNCWLHMSDAIIAIESSYVSEQPCCVHATDNHFKVLGGILSIPWIIARWPREEKED